MDNNKSSSPTYPYNTAPPSSTNNQPYTSTLNFGSVSTYPPPPYPQYIHYHPPLYTTQHSGHLNYHYPPESALRPHQNNIPLDYSNYPSPSHVIGPSPYIFHAYHPPQISSSSLFLQQQGSFKFGSYQSPLERQPSQGHNQSPSLQHQDSLSSVSSSAASSLSSVNSSVANSDHCKNEPSSIDDHLSNVHLYDNHTPAPALASVPNVTATYHLGPRAVVTNYNVQGTIYGHPNSSFSKSEASSVVQFESSSEPTHSRTSSGELQNNWGMQVMPFMPSKKVLLLHGNLDIWVCEARNLPNLDMFHKTIGDMFNKMGTKIDGNLGNMTSDPYVSITVAGAVIGRTYVINNNENPVWMQHFNVPVAHYAAEVQFLVKDNDMVGSQLIGTVAVPVDHIYGGGKIEGFFPILNNGKPCKAGAVLRLSIQYYPMDQLSFYHHGVGAGPEYYGVPGTYFPLRMGGSVTLYQDAHVPDGCLPNLKLDNGMQHVHGKCWHDIFDAICQARRLIYITGWSVWHKVRLVRDDDSVESSSLGELLKSKSQEGVRVLLLVWDDPTSRSILGYKTDGVMQTHDEETRRFFKHSSVQVLLCPRVAGKRHSWAKQREVGVIYTHHQKTVIVDADAGNNRRKIIAFVGGLDLCDGRYDTPEHPIFRTLQTVHSDDYHNPTYTGSTTGCPREPWHDLHCKIDGPAAYDVLTNFEERWLKASKPQGIRKSKKYDDSLLRIERMAEILGIAETSSTSSSTDPDNWHVQILRSIDSNSVKGFPKDPKEATMKNLVCGKNVLIDMSIHTAYVKAIRAAQHFIYIENQYFIGSSYNWSQYNDVGANNLIPMEIALKICEKIRAHQRFAAYIVIPMWPEGDPTGAATQRILFWQHKTMQMMYETIYKCLVEVGLEDAFSPQDYLNFFCLGNREADEGENENAGAANTPQALSRKYRRFMIYVHSKGMIVDDEYVTLGSANINQRSLEGTRDTEIAMGAYQPHHTWARKQSSPGGQIYRYRMSLWAEHLGVVDDYFTRPESLECVRRVRSMGEANWKQFASDEVTEMRGHLLKYPVEVDRRGKVKNLPGFEQFPDVGGDIIGSFLAIQENLTI
ncbi:phospholipase D gamma 1-like [Nicotiana tabacum]|uniref:Phospholipase D alpha 1 n=1 Tax=Nicotiana tabacum TaxID=4097 RepID=A0A1S3YCN8_TOBAC|nr:phospholipase D gamma 1-like [Nicotiana tomentosiformis]XP_016449899.1 PREDICTED: phospholipase D gamma 1-like [Nicotiana tabacum]